MSIGSIVSPAIVTTGPNNHAVSSWALLWQFPLSFLSTNSSYNIDVRVNSVPSSWTNEIYRGDVYSTKKILGLINVNSYFTSAHVNSTSDMLPLDNAPGGEYSLTQFGFNTNIIKQQLSKYFNYTNVNLIQQNFCFVPTVSSLAISNPQQYLFSNFCSTVNCLNPAQVSNYYAPPVSQLHVSYTNASSNWILQNQDPNYTCTQICSSNLNISGPNSFCTSATYTLNNAPANASVSWSANPFSAVNIAPSGQQATLTKTGGGFFVLTATLTDCNGNNISVPTGSIHVGGYGSSDYPVSGSSNVSCGGWASFSTNTLPGATNYSWFWPSGWSASGQGTPNLSVQVPSYGVTSGNYQVGVRVANACDAGGSPAIQNFYVSCSGYGYYKVSPNPATSTVTASASNTSATSSPATNHTTIDELNIYDQSGNLKKHQVFGKVGRATLDVSSLPLGVYTIEIVDGSYKERQQLSIQKQ